MALLAAGLVGCKRDAAKTGAGSVIQAKVKQPLGPISEADTATGPAGLSVGARGPGPGGYGSPEIPLGTSIATGSSKPRVDETVTLSYTSPWGARAEAVGACKVGDDSVSCWDAEGKRAPGLEKRVKQALTQNSGVWPGVGGLGPQKKNRLVIVRTVTPTSQVGGPRRAFPRGGLYLESVDGEIYDGSALQLDDLSGQTSNAAQPEAHYEGRFISVEPNLKTTSAYFTFSQIEKDQAILELRAGASCRIVGVNLRLVSITKGIHVPGNRPGLAYMGSPEHQPEWTIVVQNLSRGASTYIHLGTRGVFVNSAGRILSQAEVAEKQRQFAMSMRQFNGEDTNRTNPNSTTPHPDFMMVWCRPIGGVGPDLTYYALNADPASVKTLSASAYSQRRIEVKGIRLDPK